MSLRTRLGFAQDPLYLIDGSAFVFRGFYAFQNMSRSDGFPTNALYIVARILLRLLREEKPQWLSFVLDGRGKNFRHTIFEAYKAQRSATPEDLVKQLEPIRELLKVLGVPVLVSDGCEADDCIASLTHKFRAGCPVVIVGADKDLKQCLAKDVVLWDPAAKDEKIVTLKDFQAETGFAPDSWPDYQALVGDSSDNIPGVPQIGPKTAIGLIREFPHLEALFDHLPSVPPKIRSKLEGQRENAFLCRELTTLRIDSCPQISMQDLAMQAINLNELLAFLAKYELRSLAREVESMSRAGYFAETVKNMTATFPKNVQPIGKVAVPSSVVDEPAPRQASFTSDLQASAKKVESSQPRSVSISKQAGLFEAKATPVPSSLLEVKRPSELPCFVKGNAEKSQVLALLSHGIEGLTVAGQTVVNNDFTTAIQFDGSGWERLYIGDIESLVQELANLAQHSRLRLVTPDYKALLKHLPVFSSIAQIHWFDCSLAAYLLSPEDRVYTWEQVSTRWGAQAFDSASNASVMEEHPGLGAITLYAYMQARLQGSDLTGVFVNLEIPLIPVLCAMEERGICIDREAFANFLQEVQEQLDALTQKIYGQAGQSFNIRSSQQLGDILFSVLKLPKAGKTKGGSASTSQESLEKLSGSHPIVQAILEYRKLEKLRSTYLEPLPLLADASGRIHTTFNQTATATGRLSSSNPNLQNIPIRGEQGQRMRSCFIAAPKKLLVGADYSQIELRVLAHLSEDPTLLDAFHKNEDIHSRTAGLLFDVPPADVTSDQRRNAKTINFGLIYGMGAQRLAQDLQISVKEAKVFMERYFERLSKLKAFYDAVEQEAIAKGYVSTMAGRRRFTPDILSQNNQIRSQARRQAINTRIQGSAADIIKLAMLAVEKDIVLAKLEARLLLQIHDELLLEVPAEHAASAGQRLAELMQNITPDGNPLRVPLLVEWGVGSNWAVTH